MRSPRAPPLSMNRRTLRPDGASTSDSTWDNFEGDKEKAAEEAAPEKKSADDGFIQRF